MHAGRGFLTDTNETFGTFLPPLWVRLNRITEDLQNTFHLLVIGGCRVGKSLGLGEDFLALDAL